MACVRENFHLNRVHGVTHVVFGFSNFTTFHSETPLDVVFDSGDVCVMTTRDVLNVVFLSKLQHLVEHHVLDQTTLATCTLTEYKDRLLCRQKQLHDVVVPDRVVGRNSHILDQSLLWEHFIVADLHASQIFLDIKLSPRIGVQIEVTVKDSQVLLKWIVGDKHWFLYPFIKLSCKSCLCLLLEAVR